MSNLPQTLATFCNAGYARDIKYFNIIGDVVKLNFIYSRYFNKSTVNWKNLIFLKFQHRKNQEDDA